MDKLGLSIVTEIVVSEEGVLSEEMGQTETHLFQWLLVQVVADTYCSTDDEVHFENFFFFVIDYIFFIIVTKMPWFETESNIVQKFTILVFLWIKEESEIIENIIE